MRLAALALFACLGVAACGPDVNIYNPTQPSTTMPITPIAVKHSIAFRVTGNPSAARVRFSTPVDGLVQVVTTLPYNAQFQTTAGEMFLSLEGTPQNYPIAMFNPFFSIQIVVDGALFREATSNEFILNTLSVSGTWRAQ